MSKSIGFESEENMTQALLTNPDFYLHFSFSGWDRWEERELKGFFGIPDVVVALGKVDSRGRKIFRAFAFEVKRWNWKRALLQAFKYAAFTHYSYVVIDEAFVHRPLGNISLFRQANIGLISVSTEKTIRYHLKPKFAQPYSRRLYDRLYRHVQQSLLTSNEPLPH